MGMFEKTKLKLPGGRWKKQPLPNSSEQPATSAQETAELEDLELGEEVRSNEGRTTPPDVSSTEEVLGRVLSADRGSAMGEDLRSNGEMPSPDKSRMCNSTPPTAPAKKEADELRAAVTTEEIQASPVDELAQSIAEERSEANVEAKKEESAMADDAPQQDGARYHHLDQPTQPSIDVCSVARAKVEKSAPSAYKTLATLVPLGVTGDISEGDWPKYVDPSQYLPKRLVLGEVRKLLCEKDGEKMWVNVGGYDWAYIKEALCLQDYDDSSFLRILAALMSIEKIRNELGISLEYAFLIYDTCSRTIGYEEEYFGEYEDMDYFWKYHNPNYPNKSAQ